MARECLLTSAVTEVLGGSVSTGRKKRDDGSPAKKKCIKRTVPQAAFMSLVPSPGTFTHFSSSYILHDPHTADMKFSIIAVAAAAASVNAAALPSSNTQHVEARGYSTVCSFLIRHHIYLSKKSGDTNQSPPTCRPHASRPATCGARRAPSSLASAWPLALLQARRARRSTRTLSRVSSRSTEHMWLNRDESEGGSPQPSTKTTA